MLTSSCKLAHTERDEISAAYNFATYLAPRRKMMQWWADHPGGAATGREGRALQGGVNVDAMKPRCP
jgi:hypothetical protein